MIANARFLLINVHELILQIHPDFVAFAAFVFHLFVAQSLSLRWYLLYIKRKNNTENLWYHSMEQQKFYFRFHPYCHKV